uniref:Uncharacterized protein n=1 Tax=Arthonia quintaria TaxID=2563724 RepID=A0A4P8VUS7_9PEZI|nr:hypothetical protein [Arthonia quintaria]
MFVFNKDLIINIISKLIVLLGIGLVPKIIISLSLSGLNYWLVLGLIAFIVAFLTYIIRQLIKLNLVNYITAVLLGITSVTFVFVVYLLNLNNPLESFMYLSSCLGVFKIFKYLGFNPSELISNFSPDKMAMSSNPPAGGSTIPGSSSGGSNPPSSTGQSTSEPTGSGTGDRSDYRNLRDGHYNLEYGSVKKEGVTLKSFRPIGVIPDPQTPLSDPQHRQIAENTSNGLRKIEQLMGRSITTACLDPETRAWMLRVRMERLNHTRINQQTEVNGRLLKALDDVGRGNLD